jgi:hypothetical protein
MTSRKFQNSFQEVQLGKTTWIEIRMKVAQGNELAVDGWDASDDC